MKNIETITATNSSMLDAMMPALAECYIDDFARPPWNEVSTCPQCGKFSRFNTGALCTQCAVALQPAYTADGLYAAWTELLNEGALMEIQVQGGMPLRTTIAGPLTSAELFTRKYADVQIMQEWLITNLKAEIAYIYDTFANLKVRPSGNLYDRGQALGRISAAFAGLPVVTRTLQPSIVRATVRDIGEHTAVYVGTSNAGVAEALGAKSIGIVPDRRTLLSVEATP